MQFAHQKHMSSLGVIIGVDIVFMTFWERLVDVLMSMLQPSSEITSNGVALCILCNYHFCKLLDNLF